MTNLAGTAHRFGVATSTKLDLISNASPPDNLSFVLRGASETNDTGVFHPHSGTLRVTSTEFAKLKAQFPDEVKWVNFNLDYDETYTSKDVKCFTSSDAPGLTINFVPCNKASNRSSLKARFKATWDRLIQKVRALFSRKPHEDLASPGDDAQRRVSADAMESGRPSVPVESSTRPLGTVAHPDEEKSAANN
jgi:hypothetical protein